MAIRKEEELVLVIAGNYREVRELEAREDFDPRKEYVQPWEKLRNGSSVWGMRFADVRSTPLADERSPAPGRLRMSDIFRLAYPEMFVEKGDKMKVLLPVMEREVIGDVIVNGKKSPQTITLTVDEVWGEWRRTEEYLRRWKEQEK